MANTIRARVRARDGGATVQMLFTHPMKVEGRDAQTGAVIPPHFIQQVLIDLNGQRAVTANWGQAVSTNPFLEVFIDGAKAGDTLHCAWTDNTGASDSADIQVSA